LDSIVINEIPPLRAVWTLIGQQARIPIIAAHAVQVLTGVLNIASGTCLIHTSDQYRQANFQTILRLIRSRWRGWRIVLFLDKHSAQTAQASRRLARGLGIQLRWLPKACPELNVVDQLWRRVRDDVLANEPTPTLAITTQRLIEHLQGLSPQQRRHQAGILSENFWLARTRSVT
jgi:transposase